MATAVEGLAARLSVPLASIDTGHLPADMATLNRWHAELGKKIDRATLRHITPLGFEHINFNGVLIFPLDRFRNRLMPSNTPSVRPASAPG